MAEPASGTAAYVSENDEGFNFSEQSSALTEASGQASKANALKVRKAPVDASGTYTTSVSIALPPGRAGMTPSLSLSYSSGGSRKDSPVGSGWSFGVPSMSRDVSEGFPPQAPVAGRLRYDDARTNFTGPSGRLVPITANEGIALTSGALLYAPQREHSPVRYEYVQPQDRWIEHLPNGSKRYYGSIGNAQGRVVNELGTHAWLLLKERDPEGNTIEYDYHNLTGERGQTRFGPGAFQQAQEVPVLKSVRWGANEHANRFHVFRVETLVRDYPGQLDMLNGHVVLTKQVTDVLVYGPASAGGQEKLYWKYTLELTKSSDNFRHLLRSVTRRNYDLATGAEQGQPRVWRFSYSGNAPESFGFGGEAACNTATRAAYSAPMDFLGSEEMLRGGFQLDVTPGPRPTISQEQIAKLKKLSPMDALSPEYRGAGYRFEDIDADGDADVIYHPAGLGSPASRWLQHKSYKNEKGAYVPFAPSRDAAKGEINGIPGQQLVSSFSDVDGDLDPDAISFPLNWEKPWVVGSGGTQGQYEPHFTAAEDPFDPANVPDHEKAAVLGFAYAEINPRDAGGCTVVRPSLKSTQVLNYYAVPGMAPPGLPGPVLPGFKPSVPDWKPIGTQDPDGNLANGDPMLDIKFRVAQMLGLPCNVYVPWWIAAGQLPVSEGELVFEVLSNTSRTDASKNGLEPGKTTVTLSNWPYNARKTARWSIEPRIAGCKFDPHQNGCVLPIDLHKDQEKTNRLWEYLTREDVADPLHQPHLAWNASYGQLEDFHAPITDVNGDGRADIVLLKNMLILSGSQALTNFSPRVYLSNGKGFELDRYPPFSLTFDITSLFAAVDWIGVENRRSYIHGTRAVLQALRPGQTLADNLLSWMPSTHRTEITGILGAYKNLNPKDRAVTAGLRASLLNTFDRALEQRYPAPSASLRAIAQQVINNLTGGFGRFFAFSVTSLPDIRIDLTDVMFQANNRVFVSVSELARETLRINPGALGAIAGFTRAIIPWLKLPTSIFPDLGLPDEPDTSSFTRSALDIFLDGRNVHCPSNDDNRTCDTVSPYPISVGFNAFMFDANGDGLPDLTAAHRPITFPNERGRVFRGCGHGHEVHLNRGYRWDTAAEAKDDLTLSGDGWSTPDVRAQANDLTTEALGRTRDMAFGFLNQRDKECSAERQLELPPRNPSLKGAFEGLPMSGATFSDLNADGLTDVIFAAVTHSGNTGTNETRMLEQKVFLNTGRGFVSAFERRPTPASIGENDMRISEQPDWCGIPSDFYMTQYIRRTGTTLGTQDRARLVDVDADGLLDVVYRADCLKKLGTTPCPRAKWRKNLRKVPDLLTRVEEPGGAYSEIDYVAATSAQARGTVVDALGLAPAGHQVVREVRTSAQPLAKPWPEVGGESVERVQLRYSNYARESGSSHSLGFETVTATFATGDKCFVQDGVTTCTPSALTDRFGFQDQARTTTTYDILDKVNGITVRHPLRSAVRNVTFEDLLTKARQSTSYNYAVSNLGNAARIREGLTITEVSDGTLSLYTASNPSDFDAYGFARKVVSGPSTSLGALVENNAQTTVATSTYENNAWAWRLGRPKTSTVLGDLVDAATGTRRRGTLSQSTTTYNAQGRVDTVSVLLDSGSDCTANKALWSVTKFPAAEYNALGLPEQVIENGTSVDITYDGLGINVESRSTTVPRSISSKNGAVLEEHYTYDPRHGAITSTEDANERKTSFTYDAYGRQLSATGPDQSLLSSTAYNDAPEGPWTVTTETYTSATSSFMTWSAVDGYGRSLVTNKQTAANQFSRVARNRYDGFGRLVESFQPGWVSALTTVAVPGGTLSTKTTYDGFDRVTRETLPDGRFTQYAYQNATQPGSTLVRAQVTTINPLKRPSVRWFDAVGSLVLLERKNETGTVLSTFTYDYDGAGRMAAVTDSLGFRRVEYDQGGRVRHATLARKSSTDAATYNFCYDARSQVVSATSPSGREMQVARDALGRTERIDIDFVRKVNGRDVVSTTSASFFYDCSVAEGSLGRLCDRTDEALSTHIAYDAYGRPYRREFQLSEAVSDTLPTTISNAYAIQDNFGIAGQLLSRSIEGLGGLPTQTLTFTQDLNARTTGITATDGGRARALVTAASYDPFEHLISTTLGNGVVTDWTFDGPSSRLTAHAMRQGNNEFAKLQYPLAEYDANGNIKSEQRYRLGELVSTKTHTYDALDQLETSRVVMKGTERKNERFNVTQGNITSVVAGTTTTTYAYGDTQNVQAVKEITAPGLKRALTYDADGWISRDLETRTSAGTTTVTERNLTFDGAGCMREAVVRTGPQNGAQQTTTTRNLCGFGGSRVYRETTRPNGTVERVYYLPGGAELRPEQNLLVMQLPVATSTAVTLAWSLSGGTFVASESGYIHTDLRGSVVARTPIDASDVKIPDREAEYDAWGATLAYNNVATPRYQFTNVEPDPGTGYYYFGARPYDPTLRRWLAPDALALGAPGSVGVGDLNLYAYAHNNPVRITDTTGTVGNDLSSEQVVLDNLAKVGQEHPREAALLGVAAASAGAAVMLAPEAGLLAATYGTLAETAIDVGNFAVAVYDAYVNPTATVIAGAGVAALDLVSGLSPVGDVNSVRVAESRGGGGDGKAPPGKGSKGGEVEIGKFLKGEKSPESAKHAQDAIDDGCCTTGVIDRAGAEARREERLKDVPTVPGKDRDEFPPAVIKPDNGKHSVRTIPSSDNRSSGSRLGKEIKDLPDGTRVRIQSPNRDDS